MEKFFLVNENSKLFSDYFAWKKNVKERIGGVNDFLAEHGIEANLFFDGTDSLAIVPTAHDIERFGKQFTGTVGSDGLRIFRKNSVVGKAWKEFAKSRHVIYKPFPTMYLKDVCGRYQTRLFDFKGKLYCSIEGETVQVHDGFMTEIKGSEFYQIMEAMTDD